MLDNFLQELFGSDLGQVGGGPPVMAESGIAPQPQAMPDDGALPFNAMPTAGQMPMAPGGVPLPQPRPDVESILAGRSGTMPISMPPMMTPPPAPMTGGDQGGGLLEKLGGKKFASSLAGGLAGADSRFGAGAFMKGLGGGISGRQKSDKEDAEAAAAQAKLSGDQALKGRQVAVQEANGAALRKLYGQRGDALLQNANIKATTPGKTSWNKPANERWKDAQRLIIDKEKQLRGSINPMLPKAERDAAAGEAAKQLEDFKKQTYKAYGFDDQGNDVGGGTPSTGKTVGDKEGEESGLYEKPGTMVGSGTQDDPYVPTTQEHFDSLKPGSLFVNPADGKVMRKKGGQQTSEAEPDADQDDTNVG